MESISMMKCLLIFCFFPFFAFAQNDSLEIRSNPINNSHEKISITNDSLYESIAVGYGGIKEGFSLYVDYQIGKEKMFTGVRLIASQEIQSLLLADKPARSVWELSVLRGFFSRSKSLVTSFSLGVGIVGGIERGKLLNTGSFFSGDTYESISYFTIGIPANAELVWVFTPGVGFGFSAWGNLNANRTYYGGSLNLRVLF